MNSSIHSLASHASSNVTTASQQHMDSFLSMYGTGSEWRFGSRQNQWWRRLLHIQPDSLSLPLDKDRVGLLLGTATTGLSMSMLRLAMNAARNGWRVVLFDAFGSKYRAALFLAAMQQAGLEHILTYPYEPYDGWQGTAEQVSQRLLQLLPMDEYPQERFLVSICLQALLSTRKVTRLSDLARQMSNLLKTTHAFPLGMASYLAPILDAQPAWLRMQVAALFESLTVQVGNKLDGKWSFQDVEAAYLSFNTIASPDKAPLQASFLLSDLVRQLTAADRDTSPVLLLIEHPELLFDVEQLCPLLADIEHLCAAAYLSIGSLSDLHFSMYRILSYVQTMLIHRNSVMNGVLSLFPNVSRKRVPPAQVLAQLSNDECFVVRDAFVWHARIDPLGIAPVRIGKAYMTVHEKLAQEQKRSCASPISPFDIPWEIDDLDIGPDSLDSVFFGLYGNSALWPNSLGIILRNELSHLTCTGQTPFHQSTGKHRKTDGKRDDSKEKKEGA
jgi:hypothetical protein